MSIAAFSQYYHQVSELCRSGQPLIIYGAGSNGLKVLHYLELCGARIVAFCDSDINKHGKNFCDRPVFSPAEAIHTGYGIIVASTWYAQIIGNLTQSGAKACYNLSLIGIAKEPFVSDISERLQWLEQRFADQTSRELLHLLLDFLISHQASSLPLSDYPQYRHPQIVNSSTLKLIDGGACLGESLDTFADYLPDNISMLCLEPEHSNLTILNSRIVEAGLESRIKTIAAGLWSSETKLRFSSATQSGSNANCNVSQDGDILINTKAIDQLCQQYEFLPNLIKMDIEGAELAALQGAADTIRQYKPKLAICLYHHLDDLWRIPEYINSLRPDYKMSLGHHTNGWFETVLYCY